MLKIVLHKDCISPLAHFFFLTEDMNCRVYRTARGKRSRAGCVPQHWGEEPQQWMFLKTITDKNLSTERGFKNLGWVSKCSEIKFLQNDFNRLDGDAEA